MDLRAKFAELKKLWESGDNERSWQEYYSKDVVRRITGLEPLVGREACRKQVQEFLDGLTSAPSVEWKTVVFDDENQVSIFEFNFEFVHETHGHLRQTQIHVQRWRDDKIYDETIYVMPLVNELDAVAS